jgi:hypothetical protein
MGLVSDSKHLFESSKRVQYDCEFVAKVSIGSITIVIVNTDDNEGNVEFYTVKQNLLARKWRKPS